MYSRFVYTPVYGIENRCIDYPTAYGTAEYTVSVRGLFAGFFQTAKN